MRYFEIVGRVLPEDQEPKVPKALRGRSRRKAKGGKLSGDKAAAMLVGLKPEDLK